MAETKDNLLLAALPREERQRLDPFLHWTATEFEDPLIEASEPITHVFFPYDAVSSTVHETADGGSVETGLAGVEGMVGIPLWLHMPTAPTRTFIQIPGYGYRMKATDFIREVRDKTGSPLNALLARYTNAFLNMTSIAAACNRLHALDQRLCRWLKLAHNRARRDEFPLRQQFIAQMLGVQRPTVSTTAHMLQQAGLISYTRGQMKILDPEGLADGACECYEIMEREFDGVFRRPWRDLATPVTQSV
jgi:CRP-like cAMP-binding protein